MVFDTIIIGAGPTGMTAGIYSARRKMRTLIISKNIGGQIIWASKIENFPGYKSVDSFDLIQKMQDQVKSINVEIIGDEVKEIKDNNGIFIIKTAKQKFETKTLIIAMGLSPRRLNLPNEDELTGKGISYCATCDGPLYKNKVVAVVGGGNAALDAAEVLSKVAKKVYLVYRGKFFRGFETLAEKVKSTSNIEILLNSEIQKIIGLNKLEKIEVIDNTEKKVNKLDIDGLFIEIGREAATGILANLVKRDENNQIIIDLNASTSRDGIFAAGDVTQSQFKQIIIGCGQGAIAALSAYKYLQIKK